MKKCFLPLLISLFAILNVAAQCDSVSVKIRNRVEDGEWYKTVDHFSATGKLLIREEFYHNYMTAAWGNSDSKTLYDYDTNDSLIKISYYQRVANNFIEYSRYEYQYNSSGYRISSVYRQADNMGVLKIVTADSTFFDVQDRISEIYNYETPKLNRTIYSYNSLSEDTIRLTEQLDSLGNWNIFSKDERQFDSNQLLTSSYSFKYNTGNWDTTAVNFYYYNSNSLVDTVITFNYDNHYFDRMTIYEYGVLNKIIHTYNLRLNNGVWEYFGEYISEVDSLGWPSYVANIVFNYIGGIPQPEMLDYTYYYYDSLGNLLGYSGDSSPGGPHNGGITYQNGVPIHGYSYSESMGGISNTTNTDYYYTDIVGNTIICAGSTTTLFLDSCAGSGRSFLWSNGATSPSINVASGTYSATITYANGYTVGTEEIIVEETNIVPVIASGADSTITKCSNAVPSLYTPNTPGVSYQWYKNDTALIGSNTNFYYFPFDNQQGNYYIVGSTVCGSDTSSVTHLNILLAPAPPIISTSTGIFGFCAGDSLTLISSPAAHYLWTPGNSTDSSITIGAPGYYTVKITDINGCTSSDMRYAQKFSTPSGVTIQTLNNQLVPSYPTNYVVWLSNGDTVSTSNAYTPTVAGYYSAIVYDAPECSTMTDSIYIDPNIILVNIIPDFSVCINGSVELLPTNNIIGGVPPYSYQWNSISDNLEDQGNGIAMLDSVTTDETCIYTVTDSQGLTATDTVHISVDVVSTGIAGKYTYVCGNQCNGQIVSLPVGIPPFHFDWSNGDVNAISSTLCEGTNSLTVIDNIGCSATDSVVVIKDSVELSLQITSTSCIGCTDGILVANVSNGIGNIQYTIDPVTGINNGNTFSNLPAGVYQICISDSNLCHVCITDTIFEDPTGINFLDKKDLLLSPNPSNDAVKIQCNIKVGELTICDVQGKIILKRKINSETSFIFHQSDLGEDNVYFVILREKEKIISKKKLLFIQ